MDTLYYLVLIYMVYFSFAVFFVGTGIRLVKIFRKPKQSTSLQIYPEKRPKWLWALHDTFLFPSVRKHKPILWIFLILFHACLLLLICMSSKGFGKIRHRNKREFQISNTFFRSFKQPFLRFHLALFPIIFYLMQAFSNIRKKRRPLILI